LEGIEHNTHTKTQRHMNQRPKKKRTIRFLKDANIGDDGKGNCVIIRFFITLDRNQKPEIFFLEMMREIVDTPDGGVEFRPKYRGNIEANAVPLSGLDIEKWYHAMVETKARMLRMQQDWVDRQGGVEPAPQKLYLLPSLLHVLDSAPVAKPEAAEGGGSAGLDDILARLSADSGSTARDTAPTESPERGSFGIDSLLSRLRAV
jgi:hypothetical protein